MMFACLTSLRIGFNMLLKYYLDALSAGRSLQIITPTLQHRKEGLEIIPDAINRLVDSDYN